MSDYDNWLWNSASYWDDFCPDGEPKVTGIEYYNDESDITYNCHTCDNTDCEYWKEYNR